MKITTKQVSGDDALKAVADGQNVQMIWFDGQEPHFSDFTEMIKEKMKIGEAWLIVEIENDEMTVASGTSLEEIAISQQDFVNTCGIAAEDCYNLDLPEQDCDKIAEEIKARLPEEPAAAPEPKTHVKYKTKKNSLDDGKILALRNAGWSEANIASEMHTTQPTIHAHLAKMKEKGLL